MFDSGINQAAKNDSTLMSQYARESSPVLDPLIILCRLGRGVLLRDGKKEK